MVLDLGDFNYHIGKLIDDFKGTHEGYGFGARNVEGRMSFAFCVLRLESAANTWFNKKRKLSDLRLHEREKHTGHHTKTDLKATWQNTRY